MRLAGGVDGDDDDGDSRTVNSWPNSGFTVVGVKGESGFIPRENKSLGIPRTPV